MNQSTMISLCSQGPETENSLKCLACCLHHDVKVLHTKTSSVDNHMFWHAALMHMEGEGEGERDGEASKKLSRLHIPQGDTLL